MYVDENNHHCSDHPKELTTIKKSRKGEAPPNHLHVREIGQLEGEPFILNSAMERGSYPEKAFCKKKAAPI